MATAISPRVIRKTGASTPTLEAAREFPCDLCGSREAVEVPHAREYTNGQPMHICTHCGFVYVRRRRSASRIAEVWSEDLFGANYTAAIPAVKARLTYVAEFLDQSLGLRNKRVCDIGAGEGVFLDLIRQERYGASVFGIEASRNNCERLAELDLDHYHGTIEAYLEAQGRQGGRFDIATIMWTLENCESCRRMLDGAYRLLKPGGHLLVATGSRILVPFKKPLHTYFSTNPADTHAFRFSANTLRGLFAVSKFSVEHVNRYLDHDVLCLIGQKTDGKTRLSWSGDPYLNVYTFFERWHADTQLYYPRQAAGLTEERPVPRREFRSSASGEEASRA